MPTSYYLILQTLNTHSHKKRNSLATQAVYFDFVIDLPYEVEHTRAAQACIEFTSIWPGTKISYLAKT